MFLNHEENFAKTGERSVILKGKQIITHQTTPSREGYLEIDVNTANQ